MRFSLTRLLQWSGIALVLLALVGLNYDFDSKAGMRLNSSVEDSIATGVRGYWKLDDGTGTNATDGSGNGNTLAMTGSPSWVTGNIGPSALDFSGSGQYLSVADPASGVLDFAEGASFTITGWFNRDTFAADHTIVAKKNDQTTNAGYVVWIDNNGGTDYLNFEISDGTDTYSVTGGTNLSATGWHHFSAVWQDNKGMFLYLDGALDGSTTSSTTSINALSNSLAFRIGAESDAGVPFDGKLDDIRLYGNTLSQGEVQKLYQTTAPMQVQIDSGLVGYWTFDGPDIQGSTAIDRSGKGNNGTITGAVPVKGKLGQGLSFNGTSDYVNITGLILPDWQTATGYTVSMWVKDFPDNTQDRVLFEMWDSASTERRVRISSNYYTSYQRLQVLAGREFSNNEGYIPQYDPSDTTAWQHILVTVNDSKLALFYNGTEVASDTSIATYGSFTIDSIRIGGGASYYGGGAGVTYAQATIDDVRLYNRTLSTTEITNLYTTGR